MLWKSRRFCPVTDSQISGTFRQSLKHFVDARTANTLTSVEAYLEELQTVRRQGYAEDHEEFEDNMRCLAAPIRDRFGHVIGGMSVSFHCFGFREELKQDYVKHLMEATQQISAQLGWHLR
ncbi:IclR family transcriptional regulator C-terminal domain-containing protein [Pseudomonas sp. OA65]|uniref:IclR family transcriptional regulator domain-containing protein n=1 Tax=unclassified Pseudomonas TaxID=196821 RepID=UPI00325FA5BC